MSKFFALKLHVERLEDAFRGLTTKFYYTCGLGATGEHETEKLPFVQSQGFRGAQLTLKHDHQ